MPFLLFARYQMTRSKQREKVVTNARTGRKQKSTIRTEDSGKGEIAAAMGRNLQTLGLRKEEYGSSETKESASAYHTLKTLGFQVRRLSQVVPLRERG